MTIKSYRLPPTGFCKLTHFADSVSHKLPNGRVNVNAQGALNFVRGTNIVNSPGKIRANDTTFFFAADASEATSNRPPSYANASSRLIAEARARFDGRLRAGHADLGVTIGSWRQSWDMIAKRAHQAVRSFDRVARRLEKESSRYDSQRLRQHQRLMGRDKRNKKWIGDNQYLETPANLVLEGEFGWLPLIEDAKKAFGVMGKPIPNGWVTGRARSAIYDIVEGGSVPFRRQQWSGRASATICANVSVENPNIWLLNQLGLLNLPGVAWDLVPWSFVVNMFTNLGQMANAITAHAGLSLTNSSTTTSLHYLREEYVFYQGFGGFPARGSNNVQVKNRAIGSIPFPPFYFKMPELNLELALIGISLAIQQVSRITRLLR